MCRGEVRCVTAKATNERAGGVFMKSCFKFLSGVLILAGILVVIIKLFTDCVCCEDEYICMNDNEVNQ
jgi:hypothetical protein